ncbi:putative oxidoreductase protein [Pseudonocardia sp. Ae168_Ps1]|uniref:LLM class flavin-dependent oxidoreductase n=1 Tax=unclassified Pseudonocardia TaxID=2619320 RepID=UPI00094B2E66|nr:MULTISPECIES: LLM class flavin-dependent oxidoreductase [unclassified Pseudonocardia]OLL72103.1 putative oxidoreductase protein [Pseudonocardia sp. Ae150A_Ps1]OLL78070.1 putative oxidoreductase protein [Pseudonocardia sp. Ae168_Ps1]OLL87806.1 putative oxidoreductase protein [Pseudonocardia sp. Ae263_Ps1]OLL92168.1 putative oxidoreductase protein [Pseudonocardia sp. Ae356_Ps1]
MTEFVFGMDTFGDVPTGDDGVLLTHPRAIRQVVDEVVLADGAGVDVVALGEHHRPEYSISTPETVLAGIAGRTSRIRLSSGVTVLSSDDPVRVYQRFATLDALSDGRAEVIVGRGSFTESFPLFGYSMNDYEQLFEEKLDLFVKLLDEKPVTWEGSTRAGLDGAEVFPTAGRRIPVWVGVGGSPESVVRTARHDLGLMLAIIGGQPARFAPYVDLYKRAVEQFGHAAKSVGMHAPGFVADTDEEAKEVFFAPYKAQMDRIGALRGWPPLSRARFEADVEQGALHVGSPETVARRIAESVRAVGAQRFDLIYTVGPQPVSARMKAVELYGTQVIPKVRELLA